MSSFDVDRNLVFQPRSGTGDDTFKFITQTVTFLNGQAILEESVDSFQGVTIKDTLLKEYNYKEIHDVNYNEVLPSVDCFLYDAEHAIVYCDSSYNNQKFTISYWGKGMFFLNSKRVYTLTDENGNIIQTLGDVIEDGKLALDAYGGLSSAIDTAQQLQTVLESDIATGNALDTILENDISQGNTLITDLSNAILDATTKNNDLQTTITSSETHKTDLDSSISTAQNTKTQLDQSNTTALQTKDSLDVSNTTAQSTLSDLNQSIVDGNVSNSTLQTTITDGSNVNSTLTNSISTGETKINELDAKITEANNTILDINTYDSNNDGVVNDSDKLGGHLPSYFETTANKGVANGYAELDDTGKVPSAQLPSYVDDVLEFANLASFPITGENGKIYVDIQTNTTYRWSGSTYVAIGSSLALGETSSTAYRGDRGKTAYDHSQTSGNPHGTSKSDLGLENVDNISDANKPISTATQTALDNKVDKVVGKQLSTEDYTTAEKNKLSGVQDNANNYVHPDTHPATMIAEDSEHKFVTDTEKSTWNGKLSVAIISEVEPTENLQEGIFWYKASTDEAKVYLNGSFRQIGSGGGKIVRFKNTITLAVDSTNIPIGISSFTTSDILLVFKNTTYQQEGKTWTLNVNGTSIDVIGDAWVTSTEVDFLVIQSIDELPDMLYTGRLHSTFTATSDNTTHIPIGISFSQATDDLEVYYEGTQIFIDENFTLNADGISIDLTGWSINTGEKIRFSVQKKIANVDNLVSGSQLNDKSIEKVKLSQTLQDEIDAKALASDLGDKTSLITTDKSNLVSAVNEIETDVNAIKATNQTQSVMLKHGQNLVTTDRSSPLNVSLSGKTLINLMGKRGNFENGVASSSLSNTTVTANTSAYVVGTSSLKITATTATGVHNAWFFNNNVNENIPIVSGHYYFCSAYLQPVTGRAKLGIRVGDTANAYLREAYGSTVLTSTAFVRTGFKYQAQSTDGYASPLCLLIDANGASSFTGNGENTNVDGVMFQEITADEYNNLTVDQLLEKYSYVDSYAPLTNPYVVGYGKNLLPPFSEWGAHGGATTLMVNPYSFQVIATTTYQGLHYDKIPALPNTTYTLSCSNPNGGVVTIYKYNNGTLSTVYGSTTGTNVLLTFTTDSDTNTLYVIMSSGALTSGTFTFTNPMLNLGSTALPFEPQDKSYLYLQTQLCDGESAQEIDGRWVKSKKVQHVQLDGSIDWAYHSTSTGYKTVKTPALYINGVLDSHLGVKYNGKILQKMTWGAISTTGDQIFFPGGSDGRFLATVSSADSGWGDSYTPTADEIKAYFYGWRMYQDTQPFTTPYNGTGTKAWCKIYSGQGTNVNGGVSGTGTTTLPTVMNDQGYIPYQLHYTLATPTTEVIPTEGSLDLTEGDNQVELGEGVVVREVAKFVLQTDNAHYVSNVKDGATVQIADGTKFKYMTEKILNVFKNGVVDNAWYISADAWAYGKQRPTFLVANYDPTATYTVTYLAQPYQLTCSSPDQNGSYATNDHTVLAQTVNKVENHGTRLSVVESEKANKKQPSLISPTLLNSWVNNGGGFAYTGYYKDEFGVVHLQGLIKGGTKTNNTPIFVFSKGYRPLEYHIFNTVISDGTNHYPMSVWVKPDGTFATYLVTSYNGWLSLDDISFRAEQ